MKLHESIASTKKEMVIKENKGFRLSLVKWESVAPKGLYALNLVQENLDEDGNVSNTSTYNFNMTKEELQTLAYGLAA